MIVSREFIAGLALLALCSGALARPPQGAQEAQAAVGQAEARPGGQLTADAILAACPHPPTTIASAQEVSGNWCGLQNRAEHLNVTRDLSETCERINLSPDGDRLRFTVTALRNGEIQQVKNVSFIRAADRSWESKVGTRSIKLALGFASDEHLLLMCGASSVDGQPPNEVDSVALGRCLEPEEEHLAAAGLRPVVERCRPSPGRA